MKRLLTALLLISLVLCGCKKEAEIPEETTAPLNGSYYEYGSDGKLKTALITYENGVEVSRDRYQYSLSGDLTQVDTIVNGEVILTVSYNHENGYLYQQAEQFTSEGVEVKNITTFSGDKKVLPVAIDNYEDGVFLGGEKFTYDENDNMIRRDLIGADKSVNTYYEYTYDEDGKLTTSKYYEFGSLAGTTEYTYDENGNLIENK